MPAPPPLPLSVKILRLSELLARLRPCPQEWFGARQIRSKDDDGSESCKPCRSWKELTQSWRKALRWEDGLEKGLCVMLASVTSTKVLGDQLWIKVIGPASCGKSTLCEALSVNSKYVMAKSTIRGFHSGYKESGDPDEDNSLLDKVNGKTLVTKDGDTLLQAPNLGQILSEARDVYDTTTRTHYRNKAGRDYTGVRMTWILCGTASLRALDSSELGARFLDCVLMDTIDDELEDDILMRVAHKAERGMSVEAEGHVEGRVDPELAEAMQLTGGYINYLRGNAPELLSQVMMDRDAIYKCTRLAKFIAFVRARPSKMQEEEDEREMAARLTSQLVRLAKCVAVVMQTGSVNEAVMERVKAVAMDTARGVTMKVADKLAEPKFAAGLDTRGLAIVMNRSDDKARPLLRFLRQIGMLEIYQPRAAKPGGRVPPKVWRMTEHFAEIYREAKGVPNAPTNAEAG